MTRLSDDIKKPWLKANLKDIKNIINNQTFLVQDPEKGDPVTTCMDVYKSKTQSDGSPDKIKLRIVVRGDLQDMELVGYTCSSTASMSTLEYFLADEVNHKGRVYHLDFIGAFLQAKVKNMVFLRLDSRYVD